MDKLALEEAGFLNVASVPEGAPAQIQPGALPSTSEDKKFLFLWNRWMHIHCYKRYADYSCVCCLFPFCPETSASIQYLPNDYQTQLTLIPPIFAATCMSCSSCSSTCSDFTVLQAICIPFPRKPIRCICTPATKDQDEVRSMRSISNS